MLLIGGMVLFKSRQQLDSRKPARDDVDDIALRALDGFAVRVPRDRIWHV